MGHVGGLTADIRRLKTVPPAAIHRVVLDSTDGATDAQGGRISAGPPGSPGVGLPRLGGQKAPGQGDARRGDRRGPGGHQGQRLSVPVRDRRQRILTPAWLRHTLTFPAARRARGYGCWEGDTRPLPGRGAPRQTGSTVSHTKGAHVRVQSRPPNWTKSRTFVMRFTLAL